MEKRIYRIIKAERLKGGIIKHEVMWFGKEDVFKYQSIRIAMVWPTVENPGFFIVGGMETEDKLSPSLYGVVRIIQETESEGLSLTTLFDAVTDAYVSMGANVVYADLSPDRQDNRRDFWDYLDKKNLRAINLCDISHDTAYRWGKIGDFNEAGCLLLDKSGLLFSDVQGISREHLKADPETKFYRLNCLSYLIAGFAKSPPKPAFDLRAFGIVNKGDQSWMI